MPRPSRVPAPGDLDEDHLDRDVPEDVGAGVLHVEQVGLADRDPARRAVELDPGNETARTGLGFVQQDGKWIPEEEAHRARGQVQYRGKWVEREEAERKSREPYFQIKRAGEKMRPENERFRKHLKVHDFNARRLRKIAEAMEEQIDCLQCAKCCRVATVTLQERDVAKLAKYLRISFSKFIAEYTEESEEEGRHR